MASRVKNVTVANGPPQVQADPKDKVESIVITPPNMRTVAFPIVGTAPLVLHRFGEKARNQIMATQEAGSQARKGKKREPKDFDLCYQQARHIAVIGRDPDGRPVPLGDADRWDGIHAGGFRRALIDACSIVGFHMTKGKKTLFVVEDGWTDDGTPLVRITKGEPHKVIHPARNASGVVDLRSRPMWDPGWEAVVTVQFDADVFSATDVANLLARVGKQCGIGEGRANSKESSGCGWGFFHVVGGPTGE